MLQVIGTVFYHEKEKVGERESQNWMSLLSVEPSSFDDQLPQLKATALETRGLSAAGLVSQVLSVPRMALARKGHRVGSGLSLIGSTPDPRLRPVLASPMNTISRSG